MYSNFNGLISTAKFRQPNFDGRILTAEFWRPNIEGQISTAEFRRPNFDGRISIAEFWPLHFDGRILTAEFGRLNIDSRFSMPEFWRPNCDIWILVWDGYCRTRFCVRRACYFCVGAPYILGRRLPPPPWRPGVPYGPVSASVCSTDGHQPRFSWLTGPDGYYRTYTLLRLSRAREIYWLGQAWWPASLSGSFGNAGLPALLKICHHC